MGRIPSSRASSATGLGVRVVVHGSLGHAASSSLAPAHTRRTIEAAVTTAKGTAPRPGFLERLPDPQPGAGPKGPYDPAIADAEPAQVVKEASRIAAVMAAHPEVVFSSCLVLHAVFAFAVASTRGVQAAEEGTSNKLLAECRARRGAEERTGNDYRVARTKLELGQAGEGTVRRALSAMGARRVQPGRCDVLFDASTSGAVFQLTLSALSASEVADGRSFLAGKLGQQVASPLLTLRDAPSGGGARASGFDDEGTPTSDKFLIEAGTLKRFLHDSRSARRGVPGPDSAGNAVRGQEERYRAPPVPGPLNVMPDAGTKAFDDLVAEVERGVVVRHYLMGLAHANQVTGDFSLAAPSAWWVERGEVKHALPPVTIAGNALEAMGRIVALGREAAGTPQGILPGVWVRGLACAA